MEAYGWSWVGGSVCGSKFDGSLISATEAQNNLAGGLGGGGYYDSHRQTNEVWFKAATIVVPICGAMILFLLIALAFKVLRADHVNEDKYCGKTTSNANYADTHVISFKAEELNSDETSKKMPLLYETRQTDRGENFRNFTTARIHFGQNVNILREADNSNKIAKNIENERMNLEKPWYRGREVATTSRIQPEESNNSSGSSNNNHTSCSSSNSSNNNNNSAAGRENEANSTLDVRVDVEDPRPLPVLSLNLDKPECLSSCNIYRSPKTYGQSTFSVNADKMYDKYLL
ncbi:hypothetical protein RUM44_006820 [Polyplax serrata]|uniref:BMP and activin membrane-bound inhibitor C-terminal domain-containing protein n=1 Tax=Polyplax serrata TaxID=468196 RepID=A0ABR1AJ86_POLSC